MTASSPALAPDAAVALGIASTAMAFARTPEAMLERWLRILRMHGDASVALQGLGVGEGRLQADAHSFERADSASMSLASTDAAERVGEKAREIAREHSEGLITTKHLLLAVMSLYGAEFDRVLQAHGCDRSELKQRLDASFASC
ncbi:MAG: Clp protease N-terminal domain-containing protein [Solirubrobacteraceae bacterium]